jgi:hypothetical protein
MKRLLLIPFAVLLFPAAAAAKGPSKAEVSGPGLGKTIVVVGAESPGTPLMTLAESSGFFPLVYGQIPDPTTRTRPSGDLGARYAVVYRVPGPNGVSTVRADLYPYAKQHPVSYMKAGQRFWDGQRTHGGWYVGDARMKSTLVRAGLSPTPPSAGGGGGSSHWWIAAIVVAVSLGVGVAWALVHRRRPHGTTAPEPT